MRSLRGDPDGADSGVVGSVSARCKDGERGGVFSVAIAADLSLSN